MKKVFTLILALAFGFGLKAQCPLTTAVDFTATDCHGTEVHLFDILDGGQAVLIDFFFVNCGPCQQATPKVVQSYYTMGCNMHDVFYIEISDRDSDAACQNWVNNYGVEYPTISGPAGGAGICNTYQIGAFPTVILIMPDRSIVIQDLWPINNAQTVVTQLGQHGVMPHDCNSPGELTITPDTLWYSQMGEDQTFTILNETAEAVTIEEVLLEEGSNLNIWEPMFPYTLEAGQSIDVLVGLQTPPAKVDLASYAINVLTSIGERQVVAMIPTAFDMGLLVPGSPYVQLNTVEPSLDLYVMNGNAASLTPIEIFSVAEIIEEGDPYLNIELGTELPLMLEAGEEFHFTISPLYTGGRSYANTIVELNFDGGTITFFVEIDGELLNITEFNNDLMLYPNPANESVTLTGENLGMVHVFNVLGQKVDEYETNSTELRINTTSYENGIYFVKAGEQTLRFVVKH